MLTLLFTLHCTALHYTTLHYTTLHCTTLHYTAHTLQHTNNKQQFIIALCNTFLTTIGLFLLGVSGAWVLSFIVFICSFVPVAGVFLSTLPMAVAALGEYGVSKVYTVYFILYFMLYLLYFMLHTILYAILEY
jgi:predicted PurR-regulated permease PerM